VEPNVFYLAFDESGAGINALLIHNSPLTVTTLCEIANFVATFIVLGEIPATRCSFVFRVLHPLFTTFGATQDCCADLPAEI
jgi:hypothetical protein